MFFGIAIDGAGGTDTFSTFDEVISLAEFHGLMSPGEYLQVMQQTLCEPAHTGRLACRVFNLALHRG